MPPYTTDQPPPPFPRVQYLGLLDWAGLARKPSQLDMILNLYDKRAGVVRVAFGADMEIPKRTHTHTYTERKGGRPVRVHFRQLPTQPRLH